MLPQPAQDVPELQTGRLLLRSLRYTDVPEIFNYASDPEVALHTLWDAHRSFDDTRIFLDFVFDQRRSGRAIVWGIVLKSERRLIGTVGLANCVPQHSRAELGFAIARPYWKCGYTSEAVRAVLECGFGTLQINRIEAFCKPANLASARVLEKSGLRFEGILRQREYIKGCYEDLKLYAILRSDFVR